MKTLYVSDVDGTIYRAGQEELRESSRALFEQILSRGTLRRGSGAQSSRRL